jgi:F-type H+-transporting ATPase subunit b
MLTIDYTLIIQLLNFLLLLLLLNIIVFRPIRNILNKRKEEMSLDAEKAQEFGQKTEKYSAELQMNITGVRKNGIKEKESLKSEGIEEEQKMLKDTYSMMEDKTNRARAELEEKRIKARDSLQKEIKGFSTDLAEKFLGRGI